MKFGDNLKLIRKSKKISQEELAEKLGVSRQSISKWETGENYPSMQNIMCLCTIFKCKINELVHEDFVDINFLDEEIKMSVVKFKENEQKKMKGITKAVYISSRILGIIAKIGLVAVSLFGIIITILMFMTSYNLESKEVSFRGNTYNYIINSDEIAVTNDGDDKITVASGVADEDIQTVEDYLVKGKLYRGSFMMILTGSMIAFMVFGIKIFKYLENMFKSMHDEDSPFTMDNVYAIKKTAMYIMLALLVPDVIGSLVQVIYNINLNVEIDLTKYFLVLIIWAVSYIFKYGYEIQLDSKGKMYGDINE